MEIFLPLFYLAHEKPSALTSHRYIYFLSTSAPPSPSVLSSFLYSFVCCLSTCNSYFSFHPLSRFSVNVAASEWHWCSQFEIYRVKTQTWAPIIERLSAPAPGLSRKSLYNIVTQNTNKHYIATKIRTSKTCKHQSTSTSIKKGYSSS